MNSTEILAPTPEARLLATTMAQIEAVIRRGQQALAEQAEQAESPRVNCRCGKCGWTFTVYLESTSDAQMEWYCPHCGSGVYGGVR